MSTCSARGENLINIDQKTRDEIEAECRRVLKRGLVYVALVMPDKISRPHQKVYLGRRAKGERRPCGVAVNDRVAYFLAADVLDWLASWPATHERLRNHPTEGIDEA